jgi:hypothetical protein
MDEELKNRLKAKFAFMAVSETVNKLVNDALKNINEENSLILSEEEKTRSERLKLN